MAMLNKDDQDRTGNTFMIDDLEFIWDDDDVLDEAERAAENIVKKQPEPEKRSQK